MKAKLPTTKHIATLTMALLLAVPALAAPLPLEALESNPTTPDHNDEPLITDFRLVGDPEGDWSIELTGKSAWSANKTSIEVWSPDGRAQLADGEEALRGRNLTTGNLWEAIRFIPLKEPVAQIRLSIEVDGGDAYGLNNDYHLQFYRIFNETDRPELVQSAGIATLIGQALEAAEEHASNIPRDADGFYAWGNYGVAVNNMLGRCCNFSAMLDPPIGNGFPAIFQSSNGLIAPPLPPAVHETIELGDALTAFLPEDIRPSRIPSEANGTSPEPGTERQTANTQSNINFKDPQTGYEDQSSNNGRPVYISGTIKLREPDSLEERPCTHCSIDIYDSDGRYNHDYFGSTSSDSDGYFGMYIYVEDQESAIDPYVQVGLHATGRVTSADEMGNVYYYNPGQAQRVNCPHSFCGIGTIIVDGKSPTGNYGYEQLDQEDWDGGAMAYYWAMIANARIHGNGYFIQNSVTLRSPAEASVSTLGYDGTNHDESTAHYESSRMEIHLGSNKAKNPNTVAHEFGHHLMRDIYGAYTDGICPSGHTFHGSSNERCAWKEGWGNFWAVHGLYGTPRYQPGSSTSAASTRYYWAGGSWWDIESRQVYYVGSGYATWHTGDATVIGLVTATLWDLVDGHNDGEAIDYETSTHIIRAMLPTYPATIRTTQLTLHDFHDDWKTKWGSSMAADLRTVAQHNTISTTGW